MRFVLIVFFASMTFSCTTNNSRLTNIDGANYRCSVRKLKKGHGGLFVNLSQRGSLVTGSGGAELAQIRLTSVGSTAREWLWNIPSKDLVGNRGSVTSMLAGKYKITQVMVLKKGTKHLVSPDSELPSTIIAVHENCVSNLGEWAIDPVSNQSIRLESKLSQPSFQMAAKMYRADIASVVDAYRADEFPDLALDEDSGAVELAKIKHTRMVNMVYTVDVAQNIPLSKRLLPAIQARDAKLRLCYTNRLDALPKLRGTVHLQFSWVAPVGNLRDVKASGGTMRDAAVGQCIVGELAQISMQTPRTFKGSIKFNFDAKQGAQQQVHLMPGW